MLKIICRNMSLSMNYTWDFLPINFSNALLRFSALNHTSNLSILLAKPIKLTAFSWTYSSSIVSGKTIAEEIGIKSSSWEPINTIFLNHEIPSWLHKFYRYIASLLIWSRAFTFWTLDSKQTPSFTKLFSQIDVPKWGEEKEINKFSLSLNG